MPSSLSPATVGQSGAGRRRSASVKTLKRMLKKAGLKTTGRKAALTRRAKKAHLKMGGGVGDMAPAAVPAAPAASSAEQEGARRRRRASRKH